MMHNRHCLKIIACLLFCTGLYSCFRDKISISQNRHQITIQKPVWTTKDADAFFSWWHIDSELRKAYIHSGIYRPMDSCIGDIILHPPIIFNDTKAETQALFRSRTLYEELGGLRDYLYCTIPEVYLDTLRDYDFNYVLTLNNILENIDRAKNGEITAICQQYSEFAELLWKRYHSQHDYVVKTINLSQSAYPLHHVVTLFYFNDGTDYKCVVLDAMYGYLFPIKKDDNLFSVDQLKNLLADEKSAEYRLQFSADSILQKKRFLTNIIWPCNIVNDSLTQYYIAPSAAFRKYELHAPENILLLDIKNFKKTEYEKYLIETLIKNHPDLHISMK